MLKTTRAARLRLENMLAGFADGIAVRLFIQHNKLQSRPDSRNPGDTVIASNGHPVLLLNEYVARRLASRVLVVRETAGGSSLTFQS